MKSNKIIFWIFILFLVPRLYLIFTFPPFVDETNYIWWGKMMITNPDQVFDSIATWGKQPLPFWIFGFGASLLEDPLTGARLMSLILTVPGFFFLYRLVKNIRGTKQAGFSLLIFALCPAFILFNTLALVDNMLLTINIFILWLLFNLWKKFQMSYLIGLGLVLGLTFWIKSTGFILVFMAFSALIYFGLNKKIPVIKTTKNIFIVVLTVLLLAFPLLNRSDFGQISSWNQYYSLTFKELLNFPLLLWSENFIYFLYSSLLFLTPLILLIILMLIRRIQNDKNFFAEKQIIFLLVWFLIPFLSIILIVKSISFRYFLFAFAPLLPILGIGTEKILVSFKKKIRLISFLVFLPLVILCFTLVLSPPAFFSLFPSIPFFKSERGYVLSYAAGYGVKEAWNYINNIKSDQNSIILALPNDGGSIVTAYFLSRYKNDPNLKIIVAPISSEKDFRQVKSYLNNHSAYFVSSKVRIPNEIFPDLKLIKSYPKPGFVDSTDIYRISFKD